MSYPMTVAELKRNVFEKFDRTNSKIEGIFDRQVETWMQELAKEHPWFFLRHFPLEVSEQAFPLNLATVVRKRENWISPGWLVTEAGQGSYLICAPNEHEQWSSPSWWVDVFADRIWFVKRFDDRGVFMDDLEVVSRDRAFSNTTSATTGEPEFVYLTTTESGSWINFTRVPDKRYLYAVEFQRVRHRNYLSGFDYYNTMLTNAPRVVELYCLIQVAGYFNEPQMSDRSERELYGVPPKGLHLAINQKTGLIGGLVNDSQKAIKQHNSTLRWHKSARMAVGRKGGNNRPGYRNNRWGYT